MPRGRKGQKTDPLAELEKHLEKTGNGCWLWRGKVTPDDKPVIYSGRQAIDVRRWLFRLSLLVLTDQDVLVPACFNERCVAPGHQLKRPRRGKEEDMFPIRIGGRPVPQGEHRACPKCGNPLVDRDEDGDAKCVVCAFVATKVPQDVLDEVSGKLLDKQRGSVLESA